MRRLARASLPPSPGPVALLGPVTALLCLPRLRARLRAARGRVSRAISGPDTLFPTLDVALELPGRVVPT